MDQDFYQLSTADLQRAAISGAEMGRIITHAIAMNQQGDSSFLTGALLAQIAKMQVPKNCRVSVYPITVTFNADGQIFLQQIVPQNLERKFLAFQSLAGSGDTRIGALFEEQPVARQELTLDEGNAVIVRSMRLDVAAGSGFSTGLTQMHITPSNAVSLVMKGVNATETILIIEGV